MKNVLSINVYYKGFGFDKEATIALRDFLKKNLPKLKKFSISETGSGFFFSENLRDIGYEIKTDKPITIKSKKYKQGKFTIQPLLPEVNE